MTFNEFFDSVVIRELSFEQKKKFVVVICLLMVVLDIGIAVHPKESEEDR